MLGTYITFPELLILLPLFAGLLCFFTSKKIGARTIAIVSSVLVLAVSFASLLYTDPKFAAYNNVSYIWLKYLGCTYYVGLDATGRVLTLLTALVFPLIFVISNKNEYRHQSSFYGLMLLTQAGLMGVFCAMDALLFYFYWELALIPVYFLCSRWGGERRIQATFKFFVYTFAGSLLMLTGIIYVYLHTGTRLFEDGTISAHSFSMHSFYNATITGADKNWLFWLFFAAFAVKMPIFPLHTWQPDTYDQSPTTVTMVLSGLMVKMGLFGVIRWLIPVFPAASIRYGHIIIILSIIGIIYASCIAIVQDNIKKLVAYSSIAHIGLMCAGLFSLNSIGLQGVLVQMFSHGINIIGMWMIVDQLERKTGIKDMSQMGGVAQKAPALTIFVIIIALANIALPLTNAFVGELMIFSGIWQFNTGYAAVAGLSIILAAVYTLNMIQRVFYGESSERVSVISDINTREKIILSVVVVSIFVFGVYPQPMIDLTREAVTTLRLSVGK